MSTPKRGRPPSFDRSEALERAMELFWEKGYEGVTLEDLQKSMGGIAPPSFYHAFGSKEALFREAVELYIKTVGEPQLRALQEGKTARESIEAMLRLAISNLSLPGKPRGCLLVGGAMNCTAANQSVRDYLLALRKRAPKVIKQRLDRGVAEGDLAAHVDTGAMATFYTTILHGLAVAASDGAPRSSLANVVEGAMAAWDGLTRSRAQPARARGKRRQPAIG